jgi:hypothetical protein
VLLDLLEEEESQALLDLLDVLERLWLELLV